MPATPQPGWKRAASHPRTKSNVRGVCERRRGEVFVYFAGLCCVCFIITVIKIVLVKFVFVMVKRPFKALWETAK